MAVKLGHYVSKSRSLPDVTVTVPPNKTYNSAGVLQGTYGGNTLTKRSHEEWIRYTNHPDGDRSRSNWCQHLVSTKTYQGDPSSPKTVLWASPVGWYDEYYAYHNGGMAWLTSNGTTLMNEAGFGWNGSGSVFGGSGQSYINEAAFKLRPDLTTVSMPNFLLEILELKSLFVLWKRNLGIAKNVAGAHLNVSYGWLPTIGDVQNTVVAVANTLDKIKMFEQHIGVPIRSSITLSNNTYTGKGTVNHGPHVGSEWQGSIKTVVRGHMVWKPKPLKLMAPVPKMLRAYLDALGFQLNARIIWDAIPLSFVIDGFIGLGNWLEQFSFDTLELPIEYVDSCLTYKETLKIETVGLTHGAPYCSDAISPPARSAAAVWERKFFERLPILPDGSGFSLAGWKMPKLGTWLKYVSLATVLSPFSRR